MTTKVIILGAQGRMGQMLQSICGKDPAMEIVGLVESPSHPDCGKKNSSGITVVGSIQEAAVPGAICIDFTAPEATLSLLPKLEKLQLKAVIGTTGMGSQGENQIRATAQSTALVWAPNMSLGVNLVFVVAELMAKTLPSSYHLEIIEAHHAQKKDAPSGTALGIAESLARGKGWDLSKVANYGREGLVGARPEQEIGIHAVRGGDIVGDHTTLFAGPSERIELKHVAHSRDAFAQGAAIAAHFLNSKERGLYNMKDVLGLSSL